MIVLVDTSVWLAFIRGHDTAPVGRLRDALEQQVPVALTAVIYQEILQGAASVPTFSRLKRFFSGQRMLEPRHGVSTFERAARIYFDCRRAGITIRSTIDCLIAAIAIEHDAVLLHDDSDYVGIGKTLPQLKLA